MVEEKKMRKLEGRKYSEKVKKIKVLFVCSGNTDRGPTGEALFQFDGRYEAKSCGISTDAPVQLSS